MPAVRVASHAGDARAVCRGRGRGRRTARRYAPASRKNGQRSTSTFAVEMTRATTTEMTKRAAGLPPTGPPPRHRAGSARGRPGHRLRGGSSGPNPVHRRQPTTLGEDRELNQTPLIMFFIICIIALFFLHCYCDILYTALYESCVPWSFVPIWLVDVPMATAILCRCASWSIIPTSIFNS